jgi:hypothetical protein
LEEVREKVGGKPLEGMKKIELQCVGKKRGRCFYCCKKNQNATSKESEKNCGK